MPPPIDPDKRAIVERMLQEGGHSTRAIAREAGVAPSTVVKIGKEFEAQTGKSPFDRSATVKAADATSAETSKRHADLTSALGRDLEFYRAITKQQMVEQVNRLNTGQAASFGEAQRAATVFGIMTDKYKVLREMEQPAGVEHGKALISELVEGLRRDV